MEVIDREQNQVITVSARQALSLAPNLMSLIAAVDNGDDLNPIPRGTTLQPDEHIVLTFDGLTRGGVFIDIMKAALQRLEEVYNGAVDLEFAGMIDATGLDEGTAGGGDAYRYRLHILECRPQNERRQPDEDKEADNTGIGRRLFSVPTLLPSATIEAIDYLVFVDPEVYYDIEDEAQRNQIAETIADLNDLLPAEHFGLVGPGRWGVLNSRLSVPVTYSDICNARLLVEISPPYTPAPELAYGTDFYKSVRESDIFVLGIQPTPQGGTIDWQLLRESPNILLDFLPEAVGLAGGVRVIDLRLAAGSPLRVVIDDETDEAIACFDEP